MCEMRVNWHVPLVSIFPSNQPPPGSEISFHRCETSYVNIRMDSASRVESKLGTLWTSASVQCSSLISLSPPSSLSHLPHLSLTSLISLCASKCLTTQERATPKQWARVACSSYCIIWDSVKFQSKVHTKNG